MASTASTTDAGESMQPWYIATCMCMLALAIIAVSLRISSRWVRKAPLGLDDYLIICSLMQFIIVVVFAMMMMHYGMGLHADTLEVDNIVMVAKFLVVAEILYVINLALTKISLLTMYYRIFPVGNFKPWAYAIGGFVIAWVITIIFVFIFICTPMQKLWYPQLPGHCVNQVATWCANAASTIGTDIAILVLPMPRVWKLNMGKMQRFGLIVAFGLGFFVVFASVYRFTVLFSYTAADSTWTLTKVVAWTLIEISVGIISACLPTLRPVVLAIMSRFGLATSQTSDSRPSRSASQLGLGDMENQKTTGQFSNKRPFQKLDDNTRLVPEHGGKMTSRVGVASLSSNRSVGEMGRTSDDIPLHQIHVKTETDINWASS